jgi:predicted nucleotidyltransferase
MLSLKDKILIIKTAKEYKINKVILFGSSLYKQKNNDIDIGIKGIAPENFFEFYGKLLERLSKPVDVVNIDKNSKFSKLIEKTGIKLY